MAHRRGRSRKIVNLQWDGFNQQALALAAGTVGFLFRSSGTQPSTLLRLRGSMLAQLDGTLAPGRGVLVTQGIIKVPDGSGTTVQYAPVADDMAPWLWYSAVHLYYDEPVTDVIGTQMGLAVRETIDNKAMRRVRPEEELQYVVENTTVDGAQAVNVMIAGRALFGS